MAQVELALRMVLVRDREALGDWIQGRDNSSPLCSIFRIHQRIRLVLPVELGKLLVAGRLCSCVGQVREFLYDAIPDSAFALIWNGLTKQWIQDRTPPNEEAVSSVELKTAITGKSISMHYLTL